VGSSIDSLLGGLSGQLAVRGGRLMLDDQDVGRSNIRGRIKHGICFVPGDANISGLIPRMSIEENILLPNLQRFQTWGVVNKRAARAAVERMIETLNIRPANPDFPVDKLSGGNRQKVVIAKWLAAGAQVLVMDDPTKGVDVGAKVEIYTVMASLAEKRTSIVLASSDLDELLGVADRIAVIRDGEIVQVFESRPFDKKDVLARLTGAALPAEAVSR
jgi:ABC-type sugar transport system ATPase subunit